MKKTIIITVIIGALLGVLYYIKFTVPLQKAMIIAQQQQAELDSMVRQGIVEEITTDTIQIETNDGIIALKTNGYTTVQVGVAMKNVECQKTDLTKFFKTGDSVNMLVKEDQALAIYRSQRPDEAK